MDYEKKYNEALERARKIHNEIVNNEIIGFPGQIKDIFPELRESDDERIRKFLLKYAIEMIAGLESDISLSTYDGIKGHDPDAEAELAQWQKARAYLEKNSDISKGGLNMKAPDKLYCMHRLSGDYSCSTTPFGGSDEYIRKDAIISIIQSRLSEIIGDAQPKPILRAELEELITRIKKNEK